MEYQELLWPFSLLPDSYVCLDLETTGLNELQVRGEITPFSISHNVVNGQGATKNCSTCHDRDSILAAPFTLSDYTPGDIQPQKISYAGVSRSGVRTA